MFCSLCDKQFATQSSINRHNREVHKKYSNYFEYTCPKKFVCLECNLFFQCNQNLRSHLAEKHNQTTELLQLHFEKYSDFIMWKSQEEMDNNVQYCKVRGTKRVNNKEKYYFECIRSQRNYTIRDNRKRALKSQGSCKMQHSCSSQIILSRDILSDQCVVSYYKTHYGHGEEIQHLHIPKTDKDAIASKLIMGVPTKSIINTVSDNIGKDLKRLDLVTREDVRNIKNSYGIVSRELQDKKITIPNNLLVSASESASSEIQQLVAQVANKKDTNTLKEQVKQKALSVLQIVNSKMFTDDQFKLMLEHLNTVIAVSNIPTEKFI